MEMHSKAHRHAHTAPRHQHRPAKSTLNHLIWRTNPLFEYNLVVNSNAIFYTIYIYCFVTERANRRQAKKKDKWKKKEQTTKSRELRWRLKHLCTPNLRSFPRNANLLVMSCVCILTAFYKCLRFAHILPPEPVSIPVPKPAQALLCMTQKRQRTI